MPFDMKPLSIDGVVMNTWRQAVGKGHNVAAVGKLTCAGDLTGLGEVMDDITFYKADITNKEFIEHIFNKEKPEVIVHFSAEN